MKKDDLPNDIDKLKGLLIQSKMTIENQNKELNNHKKELIFKNKEIHELKDIIQLLQRKKFAPSSEVSKDQLNLFNELEEIVEKDESEEKQKVSYERVRGKRKSLPENLPRVDEIIDIDEKDKVGMKYIGDEVTEKLEIEPAKIYVRRIIRKKYAPIRDDSKKMLIAPMPEELLPKAMASSSLIAYIITAKYVDALPLYRQEKIFERISADLNRQTMARWLIKVSKQLIPLYNLLQERLLEADYLQIDETTLQVLKEKNKKATSKSYMWVRHKPGDNPIVIYDYASNRSGDVPVELLNGFKGYLQCDGYDGYSRACRDYGLTRIGCWDHVRRKFFDASKTSGGKGVGKKGVILIDKLYKIEKTIKDLSPVEIRKVRQSESLLILNELKEFIDNTRSKITPKSIAGKAINYAFNEWEYLIKYIDDPKLNISNILVENSIRPFAVGRRNWLFSSSVDGAKASAMYFSLIETAKKNELEPFDYLNKMLKKLSTCKTVDDFEKLLPFKNNFT